MPTIKSEPGLPTAEPKKEAEKKETFELRPNFACKLPDGRDIEFGKPPMPTLLLLPAILGTMKSNSVTEAQYNEAVVRAAIYVRKLDGKMMNHPTNFQEVQGILLKLGEDGSDYMMDVYQRKYAVVNFEALEEIKK
jgi:hypothetical protein